MMIAEQEELVALYQLRYQTDSTLSLQPVADYVLSRYGRSGRVRFQGRGLDMELTKRQRRLLLLYLKRRQLLHYLTKDDGARAPRNARV